jgi:hypothetical protein
VGTTTGLPKRRTVPPRIDRSRHGLYLNLSPRGARRTNHPNLQSHKVFAIERFNRWPCSECGATEAAWR